MKRITVIGDVLLDRDVLGTVERLCPDAPVPVVDEVEVVERPGGAGLAATLAAREGVAVTLVSPLADDRAGRSIRGLLESSGVEVVGWHDPAPTVEKERVHVRGRPIVRLDRGGGPRELLTPPPESLAALTDADCVLVADYGRGATHDTGVRAALEQVVRGGVSVVWDPHPHGAVPIAGLALVTPNIRELTLCDPGHPAAPDHGSRRWPEATGLESVIAAARRLRTAWNAAAVAVTRGPSGAVLVTGDGAPLVVPVDHPAGEGADTCGAGDAFAAACATAFAAGAVTSEAVQHGVARAADFVSQGAAAGLRTERELTARHLSDTRSGRHETVVATGGCFDLLHAGHVATLERARRLGDRLVVLLNGDSSVRRLKGPGRPVQPAADRAAVLRSLACVDDVLVFDDDTPIPALRRLRPAVFVKGGDYASAQIAEASVMAEWGGVVVTVPYLVGRSTSGIVERIGSDHVV